MDTHDITLTDFEDTHIDGALALSAEAGWPHRRQDWEMVLRLSCGIVAMDGVRVIGTAMATRFGADAATISMVIVAEAARGRGLGRRLMQAALDRCEARECRLIATQDGLPLYEKLGFRVTGAIRQYQGISTDGAAHPAIGWATHQDVPTLVDLDRQACGMDRSGLIAVIAANGRIAILKADDRITGFAAMRVFGRGEVIGPVVATGDEDARGLLSFLFSVRPLAFLRVDIPDATGLGPWLTAHGLAPVGGGITMRRGGPATPPTDTAFRTYALASQALG